MPAQMSKQREGKTEMINKEGMRRGNRNIGNMK
jgi:hypothetical protein